MKNEEQQNEVTQVTILTKQQALDQGYTKWGYENEGYQCVKELAELESSDFRQHQNIFLFEKETWSPSTSAKSIKDLIVEEVSCQNDDESNDDTDEVHETLKKIPESEFDSIAAKINAELSGIHYYKLSNIGVIP